MSNKYTLRAWLDDITALALCGGVELTIKLHQNFCWSLLWLIKKKGGGFLPTREGNSAVDQHHATNSSVSMILAVKTTISVAKMLIYRARFIFSMGIIYGFPGGAVFGGLKGPEETLVWDLVRLMREMGFFLLWFLFRSFEDTE